jgi:hypothetical protein
MVHLKQIVGTLLVIFILLHYPPIARHFLPPSVVLGPHLRALIPLLDHRLLSFLSASLGFSAMPG